MVDKVALGQVFSEYFGLICQFSFHRLLHTHHLSSGAGTIGQLVADVPGGLSLTPPQGNKREREREMSEIQNEYGNKIKSKMIFIKTFLLDGYLSGDYEEFCLLGYNAVQST
jgi:hypothetical protein